MAAAPRVMLDTQIARFIIKGASEALRSRLRATPLTGACISSVTEGELLCGLARKPAATALRDSVASFLRHVEVLSWDREAAARYGAVRAALESAGTPLGSLDTLIAAHALAIGATLITNDKAFRRVPGLTAADWTRDE
jgi:tRNA(fMet)-specific endonuclease VapC